MIGIVRANYDTYYNAREHRREGHKLRLLLLIVLTFSVCVFADGFSKDVNNMMITGLTILTGFTFTALFSDHSLADVGLPKPRNETDRYDLKRLEVLANNFHVRSRYFIVLSIVDVCILIIRSITFSIPNTIKPAAEQLANYAKLDVLRMAKVTATAGDYLSWTAAFISIFLFVECLYTFYRLAESIIAIVNTRRDYMKANAE
jgi:hypothetical protein